ncbi:MAG TPA: type II toxin-antitoxin system VapC family toxin [Candidatus Xenobia bacterium]
MKRLLDTNICIAWLNGQDEAVRKRLGALSRDDVVLCSVVQAELLYGARCSQRVAANLQRLAEFFKLFISDVFDDHAAEQYGVLRSGLRRAGTPVGANDMLIASIALANDRRLVTRNRTELSVIPGLQLEVW